MYTVTEYFEDIADNRHKYYVGDTYPRKGLAVSEARLAELSSDRNARKRPVIAAVADADEQQEKKTQTTAEKSKAKRSRKKV